MKPSPSKTNAPLTMYVPRLRALALLTCLGLATATPLFAQTTARHTEAGRPFITNFAPADYDAETQNWAVIEDERGVLYAGNNRGLLEYDGVSWRLIQLPNRSVVRSLARDAEGRIWVGGHGELGYLAPDSLGRMAFVSLRHKVPEAHRDFTNVWDTHVTDGSVYFTTAEAVFFWDGSAMQVWTPQTSFHVSSVVDGVFYVRQWEVGLMRMEHTATGDSLRLTPGGERFARTRIYVMLPFDEERMLIGTREEGLFLYDGVRFEPFRTEADGLLARGVLYLPGVVLPGGRIALGTLLEGLVVIDRTGRLIQHINHDAGLQDNTVYFVRQDQSGDLWLALNNGIARVEIGSPFTRYDAQAGVTNQVGVIGRHEDKLYATISTGIIYLDVQARTFRPVEAPLNQVFSLLSVAGDVLVAGSNDGVYGIKGGRAEPVRPSVSDDYDAIWLHPWSRDARVVFVGLEDGLAALRNSATGWEDVGRLSGFEGWVITEAADGTLWLGTQRGRLTRVRLPDPGGRTDLDLEAAEVTLYGPEDGLSEGVLFPYRVGDEVYIAGLGEALFRFNEATGRFIEDHTFDGARSGHPLAQFVLREDAEGRVWIASIYGAPVVARPQGDGRYTFETLRHLRQDRVIDVYPETDGVVWLMGEKVLIRYDTKQEAAPGGAFPPLIRQVALGDDDLLYGGAGKTTVAEVAYGIEAIHFAYAAPGTQSASRFRTRLEGFDDDWSAWTTETERAYTNLPPGAYTFRVEAEARGETAFAFAVLPPWYRTWWAYGLYAVLFALGVFVVDRVQRRRLVKKERERSALREAELRAEAAESQAQAAEATAKAVEAEAQVLKAENERKQNVELLSQIGQAITSTLSITEIIETVYENVNALMDASIFGVGIYNEPKARIDFPATKEKGKMLAPFSNPLDDENRLAVWCFKHRKEIVIQDFRQEHSKYIKTYEPPVAGEDPESVLYVPLIQQDRVIGVITTQSFQKNAYGEYEINVLRNLAAYAAIALDNAAAYRKLNATVGKLNTTVEELQTTQQQLIQQEKMASLGQLTSGIAHEIKNPLNFVNNFAEVNEELTRELRAALDQGDEEDMRDILSDLSSNARQIVKHGKRADEIVKNMMEHARGGSGDHYEVALNKLVEEYVTLAYQGKRAQLPELQVDIARTYDEAVGGVEMAPQELGRVLLNLVGNALDAVQEKGSKMGNGYRPEVTVATRRTNGTVEICVGDNGTGIPEHIKEKIFEPFFTTKPTGSGTGLGLSLSYDIITQGHGGTLTVESTEGEGATFVVTLPA